MVEQRDKEEHNIDSHGNKWELKNLDTFVKGLKSLACAYDKAILSAQYWAFREAELAFF